MVLCKFFIQGTCRFGSKCNNEHFDLKQTIKNDVESAVNGKQWPLSSYGPFKDKPSVPNFIEDQSFEEIRLRCYEAKKNNYFEQFHQQFSQQANEATNKMKALLQMTPDILGVIVNVYDSSADSTQTNGTASALQNNNPFGNAGVVAAPNAGSIFAKPPAQQTTNLFGATNPAQGFNSSTSIFGGGVTAQKQPNPPGIFGGSTNFGQQQQQPQQSSIFAQATKPANSIFGGAANTVQQQTSMFGQTTTVPSMGGNLFGQTAQQQPSNTGFGLFSQQTQPIQQQQPHQQQQQQTSIFGQQAQPQQQQNLFGQVQPTPAANPFIQPAQTQQGIFGQTATNLVQQQQGLFASQVQQQPQQQQNTGTGLFAQAAQQTQNIFGQQQQQHASNVNFLHQQPLQPAVQNQASGAFQQTTLQTQQQHTNLQQNSGVYSRMEDLTADEIEAFKADCFLPGKVPLKPPPRELVN